jgi:DNA-binding XRE family transcriptional regulator
MDGSGTWSQWVAASLQPALGDLLSEERKRLNLSPIAMASWAEIGESHYRAIDRGDRQPSLSTFVAIAWTLGQDPRELFDKLLFQMGLPPGARPIIRQVNSI